MQERTSDKSYKEASFILRRSHAYMIRKVFLPLTKTQSRFLMLFLSGMQIKEVAHAECVTPSAVQNAWTQMKRRLRPKFKGQIIHRRDLVSHCLFKAGIFNDKISSLPRGRVTLPNNKEDSWKRHLTP